MKEDVLREFGWSEMDRQHRSLVGAIEFLAAGPRQRATDLVELRRILDEMRGHFAWEESEMETSGYPDLAIHHSDHHRQLQNLQDLAKLVDLGQQNLDVDFFRACRDWTFRHIRSMDGNFVLYKQDRDAWDLQRELQLWEYAAHMATFPD
jgi:hemerythrin-like metal-binding protein